MKVIACFIWLLALTCGLVYAAIVGNPAALGFLFAIGVALLIISIIYCIVTIGDWWKKQ